MSEIDQQFIEYVVKSLVGNPDAVKVNRTIDEKGVLLELTVDPEDLGRVIGKRGATAQSLRTLLRALGTKNDARYNLKIVDNGPEGERPPKKVEQDSSSSPSSDATEKQEADLTPKDEIAEASKPEEEAEVPESEDQASDRLRQAREELAEFDDLDV